MVYAFGVLAHRYYLQTFKWQQRCDLTLRIVWFQKIYTYPPQRWTLEIPKGIEGLKSQHFLRESIYEAELEIPGSERVQTENHPCKRHAFFSGSTLVQMLWH